MTPSTGVSVIIPAYNEADTIVNVIRQYERHPLVEEVIVVSDGSTDATVEEAKKTSAIVIDLPRNTGKGEAMACGVERSRGEIIVFSDADLVGLTSEMISRMIMKVQREGYGMFTLIRDRKSESFQLHLPPQYVVGGERALRRELWGNVPAEDRRGFGVELALNYYAMQAGMLCGYDLAEGLKQVSKERKRGMIIGFLLRLHMFAQCMIALFKLYIMGRRAAA